jgi:hypothetical protein
VRPEDLGGLKSFAADYPEYEPLLLYLGRERLKIDRIQCLPVEELLRLCYSSQGGDGDDEQTRVVPLWS